MRFGRYQVVGSRQYRGHDTGTVFNASLERGAERRAIGRGDIVLLEEVNPTVNTRLCVFPDGWLPAEPSDQRGAGRRLSR